MPKDRAEDNDSTFLPAIERDRCNAPRA